MTPYFLSWARVVLAIQFKWECYPPKSTASKNQKLWSLLYWWQGMFFTVYRCWFLILESNATNMVSVEHKCVLWITCIYVGGPLLWSETALACFWHRKYRPVPSQLPYKGRKRGTSMAISAVDHLYSKLQLFHADLEVQQFAPCFLLCFINIGILAPFWPSKFVSMKTAITSVH